MPHTQLISYTFNLHRHISVEPIIVFFSHFFIENFYQTQLKTLKSNIWRDMDAFHEALIQYHDLFHKECIPFFATTKIVFI